MLSPRIGPLLAMLALLGAGAWLPSPAIAGEYSVNSCRHADGSPAPTDGWQLSVDDDYAANDTAANSCALGGQIDLALGAGTAHGRFNGLTFAGASVAFAASPPAGATWSRLQAWWAYRANPVSPASGVNVIAGSAGGPLTRCSWGRDTGSCSGRGVFAAAPLADANMTSTPIAPEASSQPLALSVACDSAPLACPAAAGDPYAQLRAWRLLVTLADGTAPVFGAQPALPATLAGSSVPIQISASDSGAGVHTARFVVDGTPVGPAVVVDPAGGRCAQRADGSFDHLAPCPGQVDAPAALDISTVPNGTYEVAVRLTDAAGNIAESLPTRIVVANPPPPVPLAAIPAQNPLRGRGRVHNGSGSASTGTIQAGLRATTRARLRTTARILPGRRVHLSGRLVGADRLPVKGAVLAVRSVRTGRKPQYVNIRTRADGAFSRTVRWGESRRLAVLWYPWGDSTSPVLSRSLRVHGAARISLRVHPAAPRNGQALRFTGTADRAPSGARVTIQVRTAGLWRTFLTPAVNSRGRYFGRRLLTQSAGLSYCLRARILSQPGFRHSAGFSRRVCRKVR